MDQIQELAKNVSNILQLLKGNDLDKTDNGLIGIVNDIDERFKKFEKWKNWLIGVCVGLVAPASIGVKEILVALKNLMAVVVLTSFFASCVTQKKCAERYPPEVSVKDSIIEKEIITYRDTTITLPGDTVQLVDSIPCPDVVYKKKATSKSGRTTVDVELNNGKLKVDCKTDSLQTVIDSLKTIVRSKEKYRTTVVTPPPQIVTKYKTPKWCWWLLLVVVGYLVYKFRAPIGSLLKKVVFKWFGCVILFAFITSINNHEATKVYSSACGWHLERATRIRSVLAPGTAAYKLWNGGRGVRHFIFSTVTPGCRYSDRCSKLCDGWNVFHLPRSVPVHLRT